MWLKVALLAAGVLALVEVTESQSQSEGYYLPRESVYFIAAPNKIRANQVVQMSVSILNMYYDHINVRAIIRRNKEEIAQSQVKFYQEGTQMMQIWVPENANSESGNFTLRVEGSNNGGISGYIFENETDLIFDPKQISMFIQPSKPLYMQGQTVWFRIMPVEKSLMSRSGSMDVYIEDATGNTVRRWLSMQTNAGGVLELSFELTWQPKFGEWKIKVNGWGHSYEKTFMVNEYWATAMDTNLTMPLWFLEDEFAVAGVITTNLSLAQPTKGTVKTYLEVYPPLAERDLATDCPEPPRVEHETRYFPGFVDFMFPLDDIRKAIAASDCYEEDDWTKVDLGDTEIYVEADVYDWHLAQSATGGAWSVIYDNIVTVQLLGDPSRTFKPATPMDIYFAVVNHDGTPLNRNRRQVHITGTENLIVGSSKLIDVKMLVPDDGIVHFKYIPDINSQNIYMRCQYDDIGGTISEQMVAWRHFSFSDSYLSITTSTSFPQVDMHMVYTVRCNRYVDDVNYLITSGGNILTGNQVEMNGYQTTFSVAVSRDMIPEAHILVWYVYEGEVISDALNFFVNGTRLNPINVQVNRGKDFLGNYVEYNAWTDPSSFIGFSAIDYELYAYGWNPFITETEIIEELRSYDAHVNTSFSHKWNLPEEQTHIVHYPSPCYAIDTNKTFEYSGLVVFTDANITRIPHTCNETLGWFPCKDGAMCYTMDHWCDGFPQCEDGQDEMGCPREDDYKFTRPRDRLGILTRNYVMDGEWAWKGHFVMPNGRLDLMNTVPDEPMAWIMGAFAISKDLGFGVLHNPVHHQATRPFYMRAEVPENAVLGEQIGVRVGLFNYWTQDIECILTLHDSDDYRFVVIEEFGIVSSYNPRTIRGNIQIMTYLEMGTVYEFQMPILPVVRGKCFTVSVSADAYIYGETIDMEICLKYDGVTNYLHTPFFIDLVNKGSIVLPDIEIPVPERFIKPEERQHLYVPGSPECYVGISGDVVGPGIFEEWLNTDTILRKATGSAEENIYTFGYTLYNLLYQKATNQLKSETLTKSLNYINILLQRQLSYMNDDGSFSMFRDYQEYTPSTWATAVVLRTLQDAHQRDWEFQFYIPTPMLNNIGGWLCKQQKPNGVFIEHSAVFDRKFYGNYTFNNHERGIDVAFTAYVAIALKQAVSLTGEARACADSATSLAARYLESNETMSYLKDPYEISIVTYALHVLGSSRMTEAFNKLQAIRYETEYVYWADKPVPPNDIKWVDNIPYHQPRRWYDNEGYAVDATSYGLLTYLRRNILADSFPIMKWLQTMRNTYAGQASTQDSLNALIALVEYAKRDTNRFLYNVEVIVQATSMGNFSETVRLNQSNWAELQEVEVYPVWGSVRGTAQGTGIVMLQLATYVNVEHPHQILPVAEETYFDVYIQSFNFTGRNFSIMEVNPCARWARPDISNTSGMAVLEIHVPTGYVVTNDVLRGYVQSGEVPTLRRGEAYGRKVVFFFDYLESTQPTCVKFRLDRWFPVANMTIQHLLRVYDYFEPGRHNTTLYNTWYLYDLNMCHVCGSFQCPFCRFYNSAPPLAPSSRWYRLITCLLASLLATLLAYRDYT